MGFEADLEGGVGEVVVEGFWVQGIEGEAAGVRVDMQLEGMVRVVVEGLQF